MSTNRSMNAGSWTKLTLTELKDLCTACGLSVEGNKEVLGERLQAYFDKRKDKGPEAKLKENNKGQESGAGDPRDKTGEAVDVDLDTDGGGNFKDDLDEESQEADNGIREEFEACFKRKEKVKLVPVNIFLTALSSIKRKMDRSFSVLYREIKDRNELDKYEYEFLTKIGRRLDKAIRILLDSTRKEFVGVHDEVEAKAVTLRLADNKEWSTALQIVGTRGTDEGPVGISKREGENHLLHRIQKEIIMRGVRKRREKFCPFGPEIPMATQIDKEQLPAITAEPELTTLGLDL
ncbi:4326_t:CDS:2 [Dentiscutata erythropus]|uniref:4326_t:CDS:1 n=1 Tax=Dentiscutata erythropus TaxID=1348616 RepID=A0A9N9C493_9GLOM|nr:4326_t:CDS:2 [Dentiscutata erythropus]